MSTIALRRNRRTHFIPQLGEKWNGVCEVLSSIDVASYPLFMSLTWRYEWPLRTAEKLFGHDQVLMVRTTGEPSRGMLKKARLLTRPTPARQDAPFRGQDRSERRGEGVRFGTLSF